MFRGRAIEPGELVFPDGSGQVPGRETSTLRSDIALVPSVAQLGTLDTIGAEIRGGARQSARNWSGLSPLVAPAPGIQYASRLEATLKQLLGRLEGVFQRPRAHLRLEEERQPVARCRRPARRAIAELTHRTEDWAGRRVFGIAPKRVLGLVQEDALDIYENRVAVHLVPLLEQALTELLEGLESFVRMANALRNWSSRRGQGGGDDWRRANRIYELFGEAWEDDKLRKRGEERRDEVRQLRRRLLALKGTVLFRTLSNRYGDVRLKSTNLFDNDDLYRAVFELRRAWESRRRDMELDEDSRWKLEQKAALSFFQYSGLITIRALAVLGANIAHDVISMPISRPTCSVGLNGRLGAAALHLDEQRFEITVKSATGDPLVRIVPLPAKLQTSARPQSLFDGIDVKDSPPIIVTYVGDHDPALLSHLPLQLQGPGPARTHISGIPMAPWEAESIEMLARALRWHLSHARFAEYPSDIPVPPGVDLTTTLNIQRHGSGWQMVAPWQSGMPTRLREPLSKPIAESQAEVDRLQAEIEAARRTSNKSLRGRLKQQQSEALHRMEALQETERALQRGALLLDDLCLCPVCNASASSGFKGQGKDFKVVCTNCDTEWGLRLCGGCNHRFPWMTPVGNHADFEPSKVNTAFGSDVIAFPSHSAGAYFCTHCGTPTDGQPPDLSTES